MPELILKLLFAPLTPFVNHPELAFAMSAALGVLCVLTVLKAGKFKPSVHFLMLVAAVSWSLFGYHEIRAAQLGWNIRVDLFFIWPPLFFFSLVAVWLGFHALVYDGASQNRA